MAQRGTYLTIADQMVNKIEGGDWPPGAPVPSEAALTDQFKVARGTVRSALRVVEERGLIEVKPGRGRFVAARNGAQLPATTTPTAAYELVAQAVLKLIEEQSLPANTPLPSETRLMTEHGVSRTTVRRAYRLLQDRGIVSVRQGAGAYVAQP
ncbi:GntR family transcriptional regulator [Saccharothrix deserti]|uniref:GntR family transcriptional regulator n=1 Tax=Saccharothrix deserti TaxID=2593674 RepID=UPI00131E91CE|nr:GntR family transcriptional regulator [Saccharothrix deserti]